MTETAVLITRPAGQAEGLCALLQGAGYRPVHCPMMIIKALDIPAAALEVLQPGPEAVRHIIFVSINAARHGLPWLERYWPELPADTHSFGTNSPDTNSLETNSPETTSPKTNWYAMGESSAKPLRQRGLSVLLPGGQRTTEELLALPELAEVSGQRVLIIRGEGGRQDLRRALEQRGADVVELAVYRRLPPALGDGELARRLRAEHCGALLLSSGEALLNMVSLLGGDECAALAGTPLVAPSARVADMAREYGFAAVTEAASAADEDMVEALKSVIY